MLLRLTLKDADGDDLHHDRVVTANPGVPQGYWLYARLPFSLGPSDRLRVVAFEAEEGAGAEAGGELIGYRPGRLIAEHYVTARGLVAPDVDLIGVVGSSSVGLEAYGRDDGQGFPPFGHELSRVAFDLQPRTMPDRWQGLQQFSTIVWSEAGGSFDPALLGTDQATALRRWVERGGHLVVLLPSAGQEWTGAAANPLLGLLPAAEARRIESFDPQQVRGLLTTDPEARLPERMVAHTFRAAPEATLLDACPVLALPDGRPIAVRRIVGAGMVTVVGLDLSARALRNAGLPEAQAFWHRVLGRRGRTYSAADAAAMASGQGLQPPRRETAEFDRSIGASIDKRGTASFGVTLGFIVFVLYWLAAGPLGYAVLSKYGLRRHAWLWFLLAAGIFTGIAWSGATVLRPSRANATMLAILDRVEGVPLARARAWATVLLPEYGEATVELGENASAPTERHGHLVAPWSPSTGLLGGSFPDNKGYRVDCRDPDTLVVPTRSTVRQFRLDWAGSPTIGGIRPVGPAGETTPPEVRYHPPASFPPDSDRYLLSGELVHDFPAALTDVLVLVNTGQRTVGRGGLGTAVISTAYAVKPPTEWAPGQRLDLRLLTTFEQQAGLARLRADELFERLLSVGETAVDIRGDLEDQLTALSFFRQLAPPDPRQVSLGNRPFPRARRTDTHGYELDAWMTQPCVIVLGVLRTNTGHPAPVPLYVDGRAVPAEATTLVRYVYPLAPAPPEIVQEN